MKGCILLAATFAAALAFSHTAHAQQPAEGTAVAAPAPAPAPAPATPPPPIRSSGKGLIIAGWTVFGVLYIPNLIWGIAAAVHYAPSALFIIPGFGPIIVGAMALATGGLMEDVPEGTEASSFVKGMGVFFLIWGILELGAIAMAVTGHLMYARYKASTQPLARLTYEKDNFGFRLTPMAGKDNIGLGITGWF